MTESNCILAGESEIEKRITAYRYCKEFQYNMLEIDLGEKIQEVRDRGFTDLNIHERTRFSIGFIASILNWSDYSEKRHEELKIFGKRLKNYYFSESPNTYEEE